MSKTVYCKCPKCGEKAHNYIREGAKEWLQIFCLDCNIKFKVKIKDFS